MTRDEQQKILERVQMLLNLSITRGCTEGEVEVAAYKIGAIVQKYQLCVSFPASHDHASTSRQSSSTVEVFTFGDVTVIGETEKALLLRSDDDGAEFWIPRSQCREGCQDWERGKHGTLHVSPWWAKKEGWM